MSVIYHLAIALYTTLIRVAALFNGKARAWAEGRKGWKNILANGFEQGDKVAWFHAASLGEFEQGRPVIEAFRGKYPDHKILLTFFSPSGYAQKKDYDGADVIMYLPADSLKNAKYFVKTLQPQIAVFIKYEFWFNYLSELNNAHIPTVFISALFRKNQLFFKWYGGWFKRRIKAVDHFFLQDEASASLLNEQGIPQYSISGDTRFDRVADILSNENKDPAVESFCKHSRVLLAGSTWPPDEAILAPAIAKFGDLKVIIAPHEVSEDRIQQIIKTFNTSVARYTRDEPSTWMDKKVLIIDTIGVLSSIYRYADIAYIGGAFGTGLHNIQEPAVNGMPVIFGPKYHKFREAAELVNLGGAFTVNDTKEFTERLNTLLTDDEKHKVSCSITKQYMMDNTGATEKIMQGLSKLI